MSVAIHSQREVSRGGVALACKLLKQRFGERFSDNSNVRRQHANTLTWISNQPADAVVFVESTEEVAVAVEICAAHGCPLIAYGTGTSLEGHINAPYGGVCIDLAALDSVLQVHAEDLNVVVQPGLTREALNLQLRDTGLFFPIDPGANASLGGMAATRASGTNAVRYGTMKDNVLSLEAVMADGTIIRTGPRAKKSAAGYDLTRLLIGSEGTLGIITELTLKLYGIPETIGAGVCAFPTVEAACNAVMVAIQYGIPVARIELLDSLQVQACNQYSGLSLAETPTLFLEFHGTASAVREQSELFQEIASDCGSRAFEWTLNAETRNKLWQARHDAYWAACALRPGSEAFSTDVCVPISRLAECVEQARQDLEATGMIGTIVGHVGDGNFHVLLLVDKQSSQEIALAQSFIDRLSERAIAMDGTCTGEHGVGQGKQKFMRAEHGASLEYMLAIKRALDPQNIFNPGKIFT